MEEKFYKIADTVKFINRTKKKGKWEETLNNFIPHWREEMVLIDKYKTKKIDTPEFISEAVTMLIERYKHWDEIPKTHKSLPLESKPTFLDKIVPTWNPYFGDPEISGYKEYLTYWFMREFIDFNDDGDKFDEIANSAFAIMK